MIRDLEIIALWLMLVVCFTAILMRPSHGGERVECELQPPTKDWHYRTQIDGRPEKCWYLGPRMKPRSELYWAADRQRQPDAGNGGMVDKPAIAPAPVQEGSFEGRWIDPRGWTHKE